MSADFSVSTSKDRFGGLLGELGGGREGVPGPGNPLRSPQAFAAAVITLAGVGLAVALAVASDGAYHDDALTHFLYARWAWTDGRYLLDEWGRPGLTALLFPFALLGWTACRVETALLAGLAVWFAFLTAVRLGLRRPVLVAPLGFCQPLFVMLSYDTMTETAAAFYLSLAVWLLVSGRSTASAAVLSLCFVTRYETLSLAVVWALALRSHGARWPAYAALAWAPLVQNLVAGPLLGRWPIETLFDASSWSEYGSGTVLTMLVKSLAAAGPAVGLLALVGCLLPWPSPRAWLVPAVYSVHLAVQTVIYWRGAYASGGYARFFVSTAPLAAVAALNAIQHLAPPGPARRRRGFLLLAAVTVVAGIGLELEPPPKDEAWILLLDKLRPVARLSSGLIVMAALGGALAAGARASRWSRRAVGFLLLLAIPGAVAAPAYLVRPHRLTADQTDIAAAVAWLRANGLADAPLVTTSIWTSYYLDADRNLTAVPGSDPLSQPEPGSVLLWDAEYGPGERFGISLETLDSDPAWRLVWTSPPRADGTTFARIYRRRNFPNG